MTLGRERREMKDIFFFSRDERARKSRLKASCPTFIVDGGEYFMGGDSVKLKKGGSTPRILPIIRVVTHDTAV